MQLRDAAEMLGVHYQTAYAWVRQGVLPARKTGRGYEVSEGDVSALAARRASGTAPRPQIRVRDWVAQADRQEGRREAKPKGRLSPRHRPVSTTIRWSSAASMPTVTSLPSMTPRLGCPSRISTASSFG